MITALLINDATCISYFIIPNVFLWIRRSHIDANTPCFADSLSLTNRMSALLSPPQEMEQLFLGVSQMWLGASSALVSSLVYALPATAGEINGKKSVALLGTPQLCSGTVFCTEMETITLGAAECDQLRSSIARAQLSLELLSSMSQPGTSRGHTYRVPHPYPVLFFLISALGSHLATPYHLAPVGIKRNPEKNNHN